MVPRKIDDEGPDPFDGGGPFHETDLEAALASTAASASSGGDDSHGRLTADALRAIVRRHQARMRELPGIEELAYEWRSRQGATVLDRTASTYCLAVPATVWVEYGRDLDLDDVERRALRAVHERAADRRTADGISDDEAVAAIVLDRRHSTDR